MPGQWITQAGEDDEIGRTFSGDEMAALLRESHGRSPDRDQWFRLDRLTVGFAPEGGPVRALYRWEFDVFEGFPRQARLPEVGDVNAAKHLGISVVDFLSEPSSVRSRAANETTADQGAGIRAADALLHVLRQMTDPRDDGVSGDMRAFLSIDNTQRLDRRGLLEPSAPCRSIPTCASTAAPSRTSCRRDSSAGSRRTTSGTCVPRDVAAGRPQPGRPGCVATGDRRSRSDRTETTAYPRADRGLGPRTPREDADADRCRSQPHCRPSQAGLPPDGPGRRPAEYARRHVLPGTSGSVEGRRAGSGVRTPIWMRPRWRWQPDRAVRLGDRRSAPKTTSSGGLVALDTDTVVVLRQHEANQDAARARLGSDWADTDSCPPSPMAARCTRPMSPPGSRS
jgi:hypothetical protein